MESIQLSLFDGKECIKCGWQPLAHFGKDASKKDGFQTRCKKCINAYLRGRYHEDIDASRKYCLNRYYAKPEIYKPILARSQKKRQSRPDVRAERRQYNKTYKRKITPRYIEQKKRITRQWAQEHKSKRILNEQKRRALKQGSPTSYTLAEWSALCAWFGDVCLVCGIAGNLTVDHVRPLALGGSNSIENLQPLCMSCNCKKHAKHIDYRDPNRLVAFLQSLGGT